MKHKPYLLITGASSGVGEALVHYLSKKYFIIAMSRRKNKMIDSFKNIRNIEILEIDLSDLNSINNTLKNINIDISYIINCAGVLCQKEIVDINYYEDFYKCFNVNTIAPFLIIQHFLPQMKKNNFGRIINITSGAPFNCGSGYGLYSSSKSALNSLTVTLAKEVYPHNITINLMSPGPVKSEMSPTSNIHPSVCFEMTEYLLELKDSSETGGFYWLKWKIPLAPDLTGVEWHKGKVSDNNRLIRIL
ncbi:SDR family oxidoreductase [Campylobacter lari]|nr:SDR family oxidoreductase [Campylobacter lari]